MFNIRDIVIFNKKIKGIITNSIIFSKDEHFNVYYIKFDDGDYGWCFGDNLEKYK